MNNAISVELKAQNCGMMSKEDIKEFVRGGEGFNVDFKRSVPSKVRVIAEEVCSFANSAGGYVLIGVDNGSHIVGAEADNDKRSTIVKIQLPKNFGLTQPQIDILSEIKRKSTVTMEELSAILGIGRFAIYQNIKNMKEKGLLNCKGRM